jgi:hypothetical protein
VEAALSAGGIKKRLLIVWLVLLGLIATVAIVNYERDKPAKDLPGTVIADERALLPEPISRLGVIEIARAGGVHRFERDSVGAWFYHGAHSNATQEHGHIADPVQAERIAKAFEAFERTRMERRFELDTKNDEYGVVSPQMFIMVYRPGELQPRARFAVGNLAPDRVSRYVLVVGTPLVVTIADYQIVNLLDLIAAVGTSAG